MAQKGKSGVNMLSGPLFKNVLIFSLPLMATGVLQILYNAADMIVVGQFAQPGSVGAVGLTAPILNLIINTFIGVSVGSCVLVARYTGAGDRAGIRRAVHTSITIAGITGVIVAVLGFLLTDPMLAAMDVPADLIDRSGIYMRIFFIGSPFNLIYNFGAAILRATGDTRRPLYYLSAAGIANVLLNLLLVIVFHLGVAGVAIGTVLSQMISALLVIIHMIRTDSAIHLDVKQLRLHRRELAEIAKMGLPNGFQSAMFSLSNVLIQSSVNSFGSAVVEGNAAGGNIDALILTATDAVAQAALTFCGQNYGAKKFGRMNRIVGACSAASVLTAATVGGAILLCKDILTSIYLHDPSPKTTEIITMRLLFFCSSYFLCGLMNVMSGALRGLNYSIIPTVTSLLGTCVFRIVWIYTVFPAFPTMPTLYISYPVSWLLMLVVNAIIYVIAVRRLKRQAARPIPDDGGHI